MSWAPRRAVKRSYVLQGDAQVEPGSHPEGGPFSPSEVRPSNHWTPPASRWSRRGKLRLAIPAPAFRDPGVSGNPPRTRATPAGGSHGCAIPRGGLGERFCFVQRRHVQLPSPCFAVFAKSGVARRSFTDLLIHARRCSSVVRRSDLNALSYKGRPKRSVDFRHLDYETNTFCKRFARLKAHRLCIFGARVAASWVARGIVLVWFLRLRGFSLRA